MTHRSTGVVRAMSDGVAAGRLELRQLRFFVTVAEELHFGRAATREHIAPSALTTQLQRLERTLGVLLVDRTGRQISLTAAGARFLIEARQILEHVDRAAMVALGAALTPPTLRIGVLDIGVGRVTGAHSALASELFRLDPLGVLVRTDHPLAGRSAVPVAALRDEALLLADEDRAPEFNEFLADVCRAAGFFPAMFPGSVQNVRAAADLVLQGTCVACVPGSVTYGLDDELTWLPLEPAVPHYPWSLLWRAQNPSRHAMALVATARRLCDENGWRAVAGLAS